MSDSQLLQDYAANDSETAFRTLVERYVNLVHSTALRQVNNPALAEEVVQAVFILLTRKAPALARKKGLLLGGWLYRTTCFVSSRALRGEQRRQRREQEAFQMQQELSSADDTWRRITPLLDEGIGKLDKSNRDAVILRFIQNQSLAEVGRDLGISEDAARKRVNGAVEKLKSFFSRRGFTISGAILATVMAEKCVSAAPMGMAASVGSNVLANVAAGTSAVPALVSETLNAWRNATIRIVAGAGVAALVATFLVVQVVVPKSGNAHTSVLTANNPAPSSTQAVQPVTPVIPAAIENAKPAPAYIFAFHAVDAQTGRGLAGARIAAVSIGDMKQVVSNPQSPDIQSNLVTDAQGLCNIPFPYPKPLMIAVGVMADGFEERCYMWAGAMKGPDEPPPVNYTLKLLPGSRIGGVVRDESGNPLAGATIEVNFHGTGDSTDKEFQQERAGFPESVFPPAVTDASGIWSFASAPASSGDFNIQVKHTSFPTDSFYTDADERGYVSTNRLKLADLHAGTAVITLASGLGLRGTVTDEAGNGVANASVNSADFMPQADTEVKTGTNGVFVLGGLSPGPGHLTVTAEGFAPQRVEMNFGSNNAPVIVRLKPAGILKLLVLDAKGSPLDQARVGLENWLGPNTLLWESLSDENGIVSWSSAPREPFTLSVLKDGYISARRIPVTADGRTNKITLRPTFTISGYVMDAGTKLPLANFKVFPGPDRSQTVNGVNGEFSLIVRELNGAPSLRVEANGYEPANWSPSPSDTTNAPITIALKPLDANSGIHGVVLLPDGSPAAGVMVALRTPERGFQLGRGKFLGPDNRKTVRADAEGRFSFSPEPGAQSVAAVYEQGFASMPAKTDGSDLRLQLQPWGRIEGVIKLRAAPNAHREVMIFDPGGPDSAGVGFDLATYTAKSDDNGNFVFEQVPAGRFRLYIMEGVGKVNSHETLVQILPGTTVQAQIGGTGSLVSGRLASPEQQSIDWSKRALIPMLRTKVPYPDGLGGLERARWYTNWRQTDEGRAFQQSMRYFPLQINADGSFSIEDVPPGNYEITGQLSDSEVDIVRGIMGHTIGSFRQDVVVVGDPSATINAGTITVQLNKK